MPRNGSGTYSLPQPPFVAGTVISSSAVNSDLSDIASALTGSLPRDGQAGMTGVLKLPDGSTTVPSLSFTNDLKTGFSRNVVNNVSQLGVSIAGANIGNFTSAGWEGPVTGALSGNGSVPVGTILDYAGSSAPKYWYLCYGQAVSRTTYSALFAIIGTTYGSGDGSTTFNLPDLRGTAIFGVDNMGGSASGRLTSAYFGSDPTLIGDRGGDQSYTQLRSDLPNVAPTATFSGTTQTWNLNQQTGTPASVGVAGGSGNGIDGTELPSVTVTPSGTVTVQSLNGGVTQTSMKTVPPALVMNKIIYAGA